MEEKQYDGYCIGHERNAQRIEVIEIEQASIKSSIHAFKVFIGIIAAGVTTVIIIASTIIITYLSSVGSKMESILAVTNNSVTDRALLRKENERQEASIEINTRAVANMEQRLTTLEQVLKYKRGY